MEVGFQHVDELVAALYHPERGHELLKVIRRDFGPPKTGGGSEPDGSVLEAKEPNYHVLTDKEINETIRRRMDNLKRCVKGETPKKLVVQFYIKPTGTTGGIKVSAKPESFDRVKLCLAGEFRTTKFPARGGLNRGVRFPIQVK